jgi:serine protease
MRRPLLTVAMLCALLAPMTLHAPHAEAAKRYDDASSDGRGMARVIVKYKGSGSLMRAQSASTARKPQHAAALSQRLGLSLTDGQAIGDGAQVVFASGISSAALAARLAADSEVEFADPDRRRFARAVPNDPLYPGGQPAGTTPTVGQWYLRPPTSTNVSAINAEAAWNTTAGTNTVTVAVLDTGVRLDHPDLAGRLYPGYDFIADVPTANDGNGRDADPSDPGDWVTQSEVDNDPNFADCGDAVGGSSWHGTQVAGLIGAATQNGIGMASVARNVMVLPVRVLGKCGGFDSDILAAMLWAAGLSSDPVVNAHPAQVLNLSLGSGGTCPSSYQSVISQLNAAGVTVVVSAGNDAGQAVNVPANCTGAVAVGGLRHLGTKVGFSSVGPEVAVSAPGGNCVNTAGACLNPLLTTNNNGSTTPGSNTYSDGFNFSVGTSFSAPLVAGTAGLMLSVNPSLTPAQIRTALRNTARAFPTTGAGAGVTVCHAPNGTVQDECYCTATTCGAGMLDASAAVASVFPANAPAVPISASAASVGVGAAITLDGTAATVAAGRTGTYEWTVTGPAAFTSATNGATATLVPSAPGTVTATLTVRDDMGLQSSARATIAVSGPPSPVITPASASVAPGLTINLSGSASSGFGGRSIVGYQWVVSSGPSVASIVGSSTGSSVVLRGLAEGTAVVSLTVTDSAGATATTTATITVTPAAAQGGGGGGALGLEWLLALALAVAWLRRGPDALRARARV